MISSGPNPFQVALYGSARVPWGCALSRAGLVPEEGYGWAGEGSASPENGTLHPTRELSLKDLLAVG